MLPVRTTPRPVPRLPASAPKAVPADPLRASGVRPLSPQAKASPLPRSADPGVHVVAPVGSIAAQVAALDDVAVVDRLPALVLPRVAPTVAFGASASPNESDLAFARMFPVSRQMRVFQVVVAAALFVGYASAAALRWVLRATPRTGARVLQMARTLVAQGRGRLRHEWSRADYGARSFDLRTRND